MYKIDKAKWVNIVEILHCQKSEEATDCMLFRNLHEHNLLLIVTTDSNYRTL